jgi:hypothetical protein
VHLLIYVRRVNWISTELALTALAAMLSPTTLSFSVLALVLSDRPIRAGGWFYTGALSATLAIGVVAGLVLNDVAASSTSSPKTWVAIVDIAAAIALVVYVVRLVRRPRDPEKSERMMAQMRKVASSRAIVIVGAGASLANPGGFIPLALKDISELDPSRAEFVVAWIFFAFVSVLPLAIAIVMLAFAPVPANRVLKATHDWLLANARTVAAVFITLLAASLLRNGIAGLVS